jgi:hypothetical protein
MAMAPTARPSSDDSKSADREIERLAELVRQGVSLPPEQSPEILRISWVRLAWDWLKAAVLVPAAIGVVVGGFTRSALALGVTLAIVFYFYSVRTTKEAWSMLHDRNGYFVLVTRLGFYRAEGQSGGRCVLWSDVDRILRWSGRDVDLILVKLKEAKEVEFDVRAFLYEGGVSRLLRAFGHAFGGTVHRKRTG